ncbi:MAG: MaoC family dehydratase [Egibacteraceae bacterium]
MPTRFTMDELQKHAGQHLGVSGWHTLTQERINQFADATGDHQWIHVDPERAAKGPFGTTIAHGYLTLSLAPLLLHEAFEVADASLVVNYGLNKVRFPAPLPVGSRVRADVRCVAVAQVRGGLQVTLGVTFEREGQDKPVCVAEVLFRFVT